MLFTIPVYLSFFSNDTFNWHMHVTLIDCSVEQCSLGDKILMWWQANLQKL